MLIPIYDHNPVDRIPIVTYVIIGLKYRRVAIRPRRRSMVSSLREFVVSAGACQWRSAW